MVCINNQDAFFKLKNQFLCCLLLFARVMDVTFPKIYNHMLSSSDSSSCSSCASIAALRSIFADDKTGTKDKKDTKDTKDTKTTKGAKRLLLQSRQLEGGATSTSSSPTQEEVAESDQASDEDYSGAGIKASVRVF